MFTNTVRHLLKTYVDLVGIKYDVDFVPIPMLGKHPKDTFYDRHRNDQKQQQNNNKKTTMATAPRTLSCLPLALSLSLLFLIEVSVLLLWLIVAFFVSF